MKTVLNEAVIPKVNDGLLSISKMEDLIYIKEFIDRVSDNRYMKEKEALELKSKYGAMPSLITWGDYFQSQMAAELCDRIDEDFSRAINTIKFDIISSHLIFSDKESDFFEWVEDNYMGLLAHMSSDFSEEELDIIHLKIMMDYYINLGISDRFTEAEMKWYRSYGQAVAI